jgi:hypothetical protein
MDLGEEIIVRRKDGRVHRNVALNDLLEDGDYVLVGYGKLLDQFNAETARVTITRVLSALQLLKKRSNYHGFEWLEGDFIEQVKTNLIREDDK